MNFWLKPENSFFHSCAFSGASPVLDAGDLAVNKTEGPCSWDTYITERRQVTIQTRKRIRKKSSMKIESDGSGRSHMLVTLIILRKHKLKMVRLGNGKGGLYQEIVTLKSIFFLVYTKLPYYKYQVHNCSVKHKNLIALNTIDACTSKILFSYKYTRFNLPFHVF